MKTDFADRDPEDLVYLTIPYPDNAPAHELEGFNRINRAGTKGADILKMFGGRATEIVAKMQKGLDDEADASRRGVPIYDSGIAVTK